jgi:hypothetical protein
MPGGNRRERRRSIFEDRSVGLPNRRIHSLERDLAGCYVQSRVHLN